jgi:DNA-binding GntR family transcriptional regulator
MYSEYNILYSFHLALDIRLIRRPVAIVCAMLKIQQTPLGDQVYSIIWERIVSHRLRPGDKLSDLRLSEELGVSRTPVREALYRLAQEGVVRSENRRGFFVSSFSRQDVGDVYDVRAALEVLAVRQAMPALANEELMLAQDQLEQSRQLIHAGVDGAEERWLEIDRAFHRLLAQRAGNRRLEGLLDGLQTQIGVFQVYGIHSSPLRLLSIEHHHAILVALRARDSVAAALAMERHIQEVKTWVLAEFISRELAPTDA